MQKILFYLRHDADYKVMSLVCEKLGISFLRIDDSFLKKTLEEAFKEEIEGSKEYSYKEDYMLMHGMTKDDLITYLKRLEDYNFEFEGIKVMETETNKVWLLEDIFKETESEHIIMKKIFVLQEVLKSCNEMDLSKTSDEFKQALMNGYLLLQRSEIGFDEIDEATNKIMMLLREEKRLQS